MRTSFDTIRLLLRSSGRCVCPGLRARRGRAFVETFSAPGSCRRIEIGEASMQDLVTYLDGARG